MWTLETTARERNCTCQLAWRSIGRPRRDFWRNPNPQRRAHVLKVTGENRIACAGVSEAYSSRERGCFFAKIRRLLLPENRAFFRVSILFGVLSLNRVYPFTLFVAAFDPHSRLSRVGTCRTVPFFHRTVLAGLSRFCIFHLLFWLPLCCDSFFRLVPSAFFDKTPALCSTASAQATRERA
ncbi:putative transmembrane protein [Toxoplasma gondii MAS]|uniref:Putative transmembrane protein n=2 Tax=Toxoplasma gondii TaxID=5811 RepID=A0A086QM92_TOXGO|nr:putative transmembrane protein [Toxoplasma gondii MAS]PUA85450.1 putative transmembrane protein [Toxoplasma gondii TgCATBr9]